MKRTILLTAVAALTFAACGGSDDASPEPGGVDAGEAGTSGDGTGDDGTGDDGTGGGTTGTGIVVEVFGTTPADPVDGFEFWDGGCDVEGTIEEPAFTEADAWVPQEWEVIGAGDGFRLAAGGAEKSFSVGISQVQAGTTAADVLAGNFGGAPFEEIATITWGGSTLPLGFDGSVYRFAAPAATVRGNIEFDIVFGAVFGSTGTGDVLAFDQDDVIAVFESLSLEACVVDNETSMLVDRELQIVD